MPSLPGLQIPKFGQPFVKSRLQGFPFMCRSLSMLVLDNIDGGAVTEYREHPFAQALLFKYSERTVCYFDIPLLQDFLIRKDAISIFKTEEEESIGKRVEKGQ